MNPPPIHCMFDLETLGTGDNAPIVQIGAVLFSPWGKPSDFGAAVAHDMPGGEGVISAPGSEFRRAVDFDLRNADVDTIRWWLTKPSDEARRRVFGERGVSLMIALLDLDLWSHSWGVAPTYWWSDVDFDDRLLRQAYSSLNMADQNPIGYGKGKSRDYGTLKWMGKSLGIEQPPFVGVQHDALDDAMHQAYYTIKVLRATGVERPA